uniref:Uncharacterized protein n=1 Tax=Setaria viridis TaxID=4556 RepID=A0A4U6TEG8_SETVI|nr:hypothetical protein SEVIR_8G119950v2 [Setaria viridis]
MSKVMGSIPLTIIVFFLPFSRGHARRKRAERELGRAKLASRCWAE